MPYSKFIQLQISQNKKMSLKKLTEIIIDTLQPGPDVLSHYALLLHVRDHVTISCFLNVSGHRGELSFLGVPFHTESSRNISVFR